MREIRLSGLEGGGAGNRSPYPYPFPSLRACFKNPRKRRVRARGLQETRRFWPHCRPGPLTGRFLEQALIRTFRSAAPARREFRDRFPVLLRSRRNVVPAIVAGPPLDD